MIRATASGAPRAFSYLRFSTAEQALGASEIRQLEGARAWAKANGYVLDESLKADRGKSASDGSHRKKGVLGQFLAKVEQGDIIPPGSILVVENVDRLSREGVATTLKEIIFKLWDKGITLQTLSPLETYDPACSEQPKFLALFLYMQRARDESVQKSMRIRDARVRARTAARESGKIMTKQVPSWVEVKADGTMEEIPAAAEAVRMIFQLKLEGYGQVALVKKMNSIGGWCPPKNPKRISGGWRQSYIRKILSYPAVIGEYQPCTIPGGRNTKRIPQGKPIADYYPQIVSPEVFYAVQELLKANKGKGGKTGKATNLFPHILKCAYCGGSMAIGNKGSGYRFACNNAERSMGCSITAAIRADECEKLILVNCKKLRPEQILPAPDEQAKVCKALRLSIAGIEGELVQVGKELNNLAANMAGITSASFASECQAQWTDREQRQQALLAELEEKQHKLDKAEQGEKSFVAWKRDFESLEKAIAGGDIEIRIRLRAHLRELIDNIEVFTIGHRKLYDDDVADAALSKAIKDLSKEKTKDDHEYSNRNAALRLPEVREASDGENLADGYYDAVSDVAPDVASSEQFGDFLEYVTKRRLSKDGRFLRVHFKTGQVIDMVPEGSIASGSELRDSERGKREWQHVAPSITTLWEDFTKKRVK